MSIQDILNAQSGAVTDAQNAANSAREQYNYNLSHPSPTQYAGHGVGSFSAPDGTLVYTSTQNAKDAEAKQTQLQQQALYDPWSFYRAGAADNLDQFSKESNPADLFRSKLEAMANGSFNRSDPSYKWRFQQGQQAVERSLGARGLLNSGNAGIELQQYGQNAASQEYQAQFERMLQGLSATDSEYNNKFSRLAAMAGINFNPIGIGNLQNQAAGVAVQAQGNALNYQARMAQIQQQQAASDAQLGLYNSYNEGLGSVMNPDNSNFTGVRDGMRYVAGNPVGNGGL